MFKMHHFPGRHIRFFFAARSRRCLRGDGFFKVSYLLRQLTQASVIIIALARTDAVPVSADSFHFVSSRTIIGAEQTLLTLTNYAG